MVLGFGVWFVRRGPWIASTPLSGVRLLGRRPPRQSPIPLNRLNGSFWEVEASDDEVTEFDRTEEGSELAGAVHEVQVQVHRGQEDDLDSIEVLEENVEVGPRRSARKSHPPSRYPP